MDQNNISDSEVQSMIIKSLGLALLDLFEWVGDNVDDADDIPEFVTAKLILTAYSDRFIEK